MDLMRQISVAIGMPVVIGLALTACISAAPNPSLPSSQPQQAARTSETISYGQEFFPEGAKPRQSAPRAIVHYFRIPASFTVSIAVAEDLTSVDRLAASQGAQVGLNAGFFDPVNGLSTAYLMQAGKQVGDPQQNSRLVNNPDLQPYLQQIFNRSEFRRYHCSDRSSHRSRYSINRHEDPVPQGCQIIDAVGAGPQLLPQLTAEAEGFWDAKRGRDAIGLNQPNARSAIGLTAAGEILLVMVAQVQPEGGMTLPELAQWMQRFGAVQALNLDGGTSSAFYSAIGSAQISKFGKLDAAGNAIGRPVKSVILVHPSP